MACPRQPPEFKVAIDGTPMNLCDISFLRGRIELSGQWIPPFDISPYRSQLTLTTRKRRWRCPPDRFVEYGQEDEPWARYLGFGGEREVDVQRTFEGVIEAVDIICPDGPALRTNVTFAPLKG